jgi:predicted transcriptional regulator
MITVDVKLNISDDVLAQLQEQANSRNVSLDVVVSDVLADYFEEPFEDPTEEELVAHIRQGMREALAGNHRPAHEVLDEIERELSDDANTG